MSVDETWQAQPVENRSPVSSRSAVAQPIRSAADLSLPTMLSALDWAASYNDNDRCEVLITAIYRELDRRF